MRRSDQYNADDVTASKQALFDAFVAPGELVNPIETDFNEIHAMYPFLPVDPPIISSVLRNVDGSAGTVYSYQIPEAAKLMRISTSGANARYWSFTYQSSVTDHNQGDGWHILPSNNLTPWIYCGHMQQVHIIGQTGFGRVGIEFAAMHARVKK